MPVDGHEICPTRFVFVRAYGVRGPAAPTCTWCGPSRATQLSGFDEMARSCRVHCLLFARDDLLSRALVKLDESFVDETPPDTAGAGERCGDRMIGFGVMFARGRPVWSFRRRHPAAAEAEPQFARVVPGGEAPSAAVGVGFYRTQHGRVPTRPRWVVAGRVVAGVWTCGHLFALRWFSKH